MSNMDGFQGRASDPKTSIEDFPTPKWATRAFIEHCLPRDLGELTVWEPCANRGYMTSVLDEYFGTVIGSDAYDYGAGFPIIDFLKGPTPMDYGQEVDMIITNPPFNKFCEFVERWHNETNVDRLCLFGRLGSLEGVDRYERIWGGAGGPTYVHPYVERVPIFEGKLERGGATKMPYAWFQWERGKDNYQRTRLTWIPPSKKRFDRDEDWPDGS
jgi:hypothetical protein